MGILLLVLTLMKSGIGLLYLLSEIVESIYSAIFSTLQQLLYCQHFMIFHPSVFSIRIFYLFSPSFRAVANSLRETMIMHGSLYQRYIILIQYT